MGWIPNLHVLTTNISPMEELFSVCDLYRSELEDAVCGLQTRGLLEATSTSRRSSRSARSRTESTRERLWSETEVRSLRSCSLVMIAILGRRLHPTQSSYWSIHMDDYFANVFSCEFLVGVLYCWVLFKISHWRGGSRSSCLRYYARTCCFKAS